MNEPLITTFQALLLLKNRSQRTGKHHKRWYLLGLACRVMQFLGFQRDRTSAHGIQVERRLFWTCYILDKLLGVDRTPYSPIGTVSVSLFYSPTVGHPWMLRRSDSNAYLVSETEVREFPFLQQLSYKSK